MHKVVVQEGYSLPFASFGAAKGKSKAKRKTKGKGRTLKACGRAWKGFKKKHPNHKWRTFASKCMKGKIRIRK